MYFICTVMWTLLLILTVILNFWIVTHVFFTCSNIASMIWPECHNIIYGAVISAILILRTFIHILSFSCTVLWLFRLTTFQVSRTQAGAPFSLWTWHIMNRWDLPIMINYFLFFYYVYYAVYVSFTYHD